MTRLVRDSKIHSPHLDAREVMGIIADNLSKAGRSWGCVSAIDSGRPTIWIADAHRHDGKRHVARAEEKLVIDRVSGRKILRR